MPRPSCSIRRETTATGPVWSWLRRQGQVEDELITMETGDMGIGLGTTVITFTRHRVFEVEVEEGISKILTAVGWSCWRWRNHGGAG